MLIEAGRRVATMPMRGPLLTPRACQSVWRTVVVAVVLVGLMLLVWCSRWGMIVGPDSLGYQAMSEALLQTRQPQTAHWPPGYAAVLAFGQWAGLTFQGAARFVNWLCFLAAGGFSYALLRANGVGDGPYNVLGVLLLSWSTSVFDLHLFALSEPLFLVVWLSGMCLTLAYMRSGSVPFLMAGAVALGSATWVRYAGLFFTPVPALAWLVCDRRPLRRRVGGAGALMALGLLPFALLRFISSAFWGLGATRPLAIHPMGAEKWSGLGRTLLTWALPTGVVLRLPEVIPLLAGVSFLLTIALLACWCLLRRWQAGLVLAASALLYLLGLVVSVSFADYSTPFDNRLLFPLYVLAVPFGLAVLARTAPNRWRSCLLAGMLAYGVASTARCLRYAWNHAGEPKGYDEVSWSRRGFVGIVRALPADTFLVSNGSWMVGRVSGRPALPTPRRYDPITRQPVTDMAELRLRLATLPAGTVAVLDIAGEDRPYCEPASALAVTLTLSVVAQGEGWILYASPGLLMGP